MTENRRYFSIDYDEEYYIFDSNKISKEKVLEKAEYSYVFGDSLMENEVLDLLNENEQLKQQISEQAIQLDYLKDENRHMSEVLDENKQLKQQLHNFVQLANENDKTLNELYQYMESYFDSRHENTYWNPKNLRG